MADMVDPKQVTFSHSVEKTLCEIVDTYNKNAPRNREASLSMLKAVYRRGANAFSPSDTAAPNRDSLASVRVSAFLHLLKNGRPSNPNYRMDNDLLPVSHPLSTRSAVASAVDDYAEELTVTIKSEEEYESPESAILAMTEYLGLGYEAEPAVRAAWLRGVQTSTSPFHRAFSVAKYAFESNDADLLPKPEKGVF